MKAKSSAVARGIFDNSIQGDGRIKYGGGKKATFAVAASSRRFNRL
jgi:hypothetical protein